jgi:hypothetical protein
MSDGGKGSVRRNEDNDAYRNNYDAIFGRNNNKKEQTPMIEEHEHDETETCHHCSGCGEGQYEGTTCRWCNGYGEVPVDSVEEDNDYEL